jgi:hypothetical protein
MRRHVLPTAPSPITTHLLSQYIFHPLEDWGPYFIVFISGGSMWLPHMLDIMCSNFINMKDVEELKLNMLLPRHTFSIPFECVK